MLGRLLAGVLSSSDDSNEGSWNITRTSGRELLLLLIDEICCAMRPHQDSEVVHQQQWETNFLNSTPSCTMQVGGWVITDADAKMCVQVKAVVK